MVNSVLLPMRSKFVGQMLARVGELESLRLAVNAGLDPKAAIDEIGEITHRMSGVAETLGFPRIGRLALEVDARLGPARRDATQISDCWGVVEPILEDLMDELEAELDAT